MLIRELRTRNAPEGHLGLEIEVEAAETLPKDVPAPWLAKPDHSLRGKKFSRETRDDPSSMEYVTGGCIKADGYKRAKIKRLTDMLSDKKYGVDADSPRTSVHVHVNVSELTFLQYWTAVMCYWIIEDSLMDYCGEERKGNMFCLRLQDAEGILSTIERSLKAVNSKTNPLSYLYSDAIRYCAINLKATPELGSIEFRGMRGTIDPDIIDTWSTMVYDVVDKSKRWATPEEALDFFWEQGPNNFLSSLTNYSNFMKLSSGRTWKEDSTNNASALSDIIYTTNWLKLDKNVDEVFKKKSRSARTRESIIGGAPSRRSTRITTEIAWGTRHPLD